VLIAFFACLSLPFGLLLALICYLAGMMYVSVAPVL